MDNQYKQECYPKYMKKSSENDIPTKTWLSPNNAKLSDYFPDLYIECAS